MKLHYDLHVCLNCNVSYMFKTGYSIFSADVDYKEIKSYWNINLCDWLWILAILSYLSKNSAYIF